MAYGLRTTLPGHLQLIMQMTFRGERIASF